MKKIKYPGKEDWEVFTQRPELEKKDLNALVKNILTAVKEKGDEALFEFSEKYDGIQLVDLKVSEEEIRELVLQQELKEAIQVAKNNIEKFHQSQLIEEPVVETTKGVSCWRRSVGIEKVGLYIPGGSAPLFSTVLMLGIPAVLAQCKEVVLCTPPDKEGKIHPAILYTANLVGIKNIYKVGGAQAIAAMAFGTESISKVHKIFGPGNQYVTKAKELVQQEAVAIDIPAGPSEVLVIADKTCRPEFVAADLLSQAEHGEDSQVMLLSNNAKVIDEVNLEMEKQLEQLPRKAITAKALENASSILLNSMEECIEFSNVYAPEHLILATEQADDLLDNITNSGSVFIGNYSCESAGDYASGTNHTLPTNGFARTYSGVSMDSFLKKITFQKLTAEGIQKLGPTIEIMAEAEELMAHKNAVSIRLQELRNGR
ncbi:MAG: histidinol dehydrogenase [Flavobacteriales bacterium]|nr:histidinol dehydrogenase [Flavobacteriales bacterium]